MNIKKFSVGGYPSKVIALFVILALPAILWQALSYRRGAVTYDDLRSRTPTTNGENKAPSPQPPSRESLKSPLFNQELPVPKTWKFYNRDFQMAKFSFSYPANATISDGDESSGSIDLLDEQKKTAFSIERFPFYGWANPDYVRETSYKEGAKTKWFIKIANENVTNYSEENYVFTPIRFFNDKEYFRVEGNPDEKGNLPSPLSSTKVNYYFGILNGKGVFIIDQRLFPESDIFRVLQTLNVN